MELYNSSSIYAKTLMDQIKMCIFNLRYGNRVHEIQHLMLSMIYQPAPCNFTICKQNIFSFCMHKLLVFITWYVKLQSWRKHASCRAIENVSLVMHAWRSIKTTYHRQHIQCIALSMVISKLIEREFEVSNSQSNVMLFTHPLSYCNHMHSWSLLLDSTGIDSIEVYWSTQSPG